MKRHFTIKINGDFQHKGYKLRTMILADKFRIKGSVAEGLNKIIIEAEGDENNLEAFFNSVIDSHKETGNQEFTIVKGELPLSYFDDFRIL